MIEKHCHSCENFSGKTFYDCHRAEECYLDRSHWVAMSEQGVDEFLTEEEMRV